MYNGRTDQVLLKSRHCWISQFFARKLIRPIENDGYKDIINEARAIDKLCIYERHEHIVAVLTWGKLQQSPYYYFDMELCDFSLDDYLQEKRVPEFFLPELYHHQPSKSSLEMRLWHLWNIMEQVTTGLAFIHMKEEVHRDLKPSNSKIPLNRNFWLMWLI